MCLEDKALKLKCDSIIDEWYKTRWGKSKESLKFLEAHSNDYDDTDKYDKRIIKDGD